MEVGPCFSPAAPGAGISRDSRRPHRPEPANQHPLPAREHPTKLAARDRLLFLSWPAGLRPPDPAQAASPTLQSPPRPRVTTSHHHSRPTCRVACRAALMTCSSPPLSWPAQSTSPHLFPFLTPAPCVHVGGLRSLSTGRSELQHLSIPALDSPCLLPSTSHTPLNASLPAQSLYLSLGEASQERGPPHLQPRLTILTSASYIQGERREPHHLVRATRLDRVIENSKSEWLHLQLCGPRRNPITASASHQPPTQRRPAVREPELDSSRHPPLPHNRSPIDGRHCPTRRMQG